MKLSEFWFLMDHEFGSVYAKVLARDLVLGELGNITAEQALERGENLATIWKAVCDMQDVPQERRWGPDLPPKS